MSVPTPPDPFDPDTEDLSEDTGLYRVGSNARPITAFNPGEGAPTRFAFFGSPTVPVLYAADTPASALAETLLHDLPVEGGNLPYGAYAGAVMGLLRTIRPLRLARLRGLGLRRLALTADQLTSSPASTYSRTVQWAAAAHTAGFDGLAWTSRMCNDSRAVVLFGDRCRDAVEQDPGFGMIFQSGPGLDWLVDVCAPLKVNVLPPDAAT